MVLVQLTSPLPTTLSRVAEKQLALREKTLIIPPGREISFSIPKEQVNYLILLTSAKILYCQKILQVFIGCRLAALQLDMPNQITAVLLWIWMLNCAKHH